jgi:uncharacterized protein (TIGR02646 family)
MKHIVKGPEPTAFTDWKTMANENWQPTYSILRGSEKKAVKDALMDEQGHICCYCERRLIDSDSHIEHFRPQSAPAVDPLDFSNLLCSCQNRIKTGEPRHCGNLKDKWFDAVLLVSPLDPGCEARFNFTGDGQIKAARETDAAACETITRLGLAHPKLNALRMAAIDPFLDDTLTTSELGEFVTGYLEKDRDGQFGEFWTTIRYLFADYATT